MKYTIQDFAGLYVETNEINKAMRRNKLEFLDTCLNVVYIFHPETPIDWLPDRNCLPYFYYLKTENNYAEGRRFEEGFVRIDEEKPRLLMFYIKTYYKWRVGGGLGYDEHYFRKTIYSIDEEPDYVFTIVKRKELYFKDADRTFKPIASDIEDRQWIFGDKELDIIAEIWKLKHNFDHEGWDNYLTDYVKFAHKKGNSIEDIDSNIDSPNWDRNRIENLINSNDGKT